MKRRRPGIGLDVMEGSSKSVGPDNSRIAKICMFGLGTRTTRRNQARDCERMREPHGSMTSKQGPLNLAREVKKMAHP
jgi:hypothetical protein